MFFRAFALAAIVVASLMAPINDTPVLSQSGKSANTIADLPKPIKHEFNVGTAPIGRLAYSSKLKLLASTPEFYNFIGVKPRLPIYLWEMPSGRLRDILDGHGQIIHHIGFAPNPALLLSGASDGIRLWDPIKKIRLEDPLNDVKGWGRPTPSGKEIFQVDDSGSVLLWDFQTKTIARTFKRTAEELSGNESAASLSATISPNEQFLTVGGGLINHKIIVWDFRTGKIVAVFHHAPEFRQLFFSNDSEYLICSGTELRNGVYDKNVLGVWNTKNWQRLYESKTQGDAIVAIETVLNNKILLVIEAVRLPEEEDLALTFKSTINGYSISTGKQLLSYDTGFSKDTWCQSAVFMEDINAICIGTNDGQLIFYSVSEIMKKIK